MHETIVLYSMDSSAIILNLLSCCTIWEWNAEVKCVLREHESWKCCWFSALLKSLQVTNSCIPESQAESTLQR